jgi:hypothetical protein
MGIAASVRLAALCAVSGSAEIDYSLMIFFLKLIWFD